MVTKFSVFFKIILLIYKLFKVDKKKGLLQFVIKGAVILKLGFFHFI